MHKCAFTDHRIVAQYCAFKHHRACFEPALATDHCTAHLDTFPNVGVSPDNRYVIVSDLGLDKVLIFRFDAETGKLSPPDPPFAAVTTNPKLLIFPAIKPANDNSPSEKSSWVFT